MSFGHRGEGPERTQRIQRSDRTCDLPLQLPKCRWIHCGVGDSAPVGRHRESAHLSGIDEQISASEAAVIVMKTTVMSMLDHKAAGPPE